MGFLERGKGGGGKRTGGLDLAAVHGKAEARTPVEKSLPDRVAHGFDHFARQPAERLPRRRFVLARRCDGHFLEEDGNALDGLVAQRPLKGRELEAVGNLVGEIARGEAAGFSGRGSFTRCRLAFLKTDSPPYCQQILPSWLSHRFESWPYNL